VSGTLRVVDPHFHLWDDLSTGNYRMRTPEAAGYLFQNYLSEGRGEVELAGAVHIEAIAHDPIAETAYVQSVADTSSFPIGIVAHVDLAAPDAAAALDRQLAVAPALRGIRQILNRHPDPAWNYVDDDYLALPAFEAGFRLLESRGLSFDMQLYPAQMSAAAALAARHAGTQIIVNHAGMWVDRTLAGWRQWRDGIRRLAAHPNVAVKISGLCKFDRDWTVESYRPIVYETLDAFGTERSMFASNFPVDKRRADFVTVWRTFERIVADLSVAERAALFSENARRLYRL
jgi:predicted TIM-barrel fold metal-dependent hydrolase